MSRHGSGRRLRGGARSNYEAIRTHLMSVERIHADDTPAPVLAKLKTVTGRIWTYVRSLGNVNSAQARTPIIGDTVLDAELAEPAVRK
jgi:hypothetical protein